MTARAAVSFSKGEGKGTLRGEPFLPCFVSYIQEVPIFTSRSLKPLSIFAHRQTLSRKASPLTYQKAPKSPSGVSLGEHKNRPYLTPSAAMPST
jgi:hypothetical protein